MMRTIAEVGGGRRLWYDTDEIERIAFDALKDAGLWPINDGYAIDIEELLEVHLGAAVDYSAPLGRTVLGYTSFGSPIRVAINRTLTEAANKPSHHRAALGRWREHWHMRERTSSCTHASMHLPLGTAQLRLDACERMLPRHARRIGAKCRPTWEWVPCCCRGLPLGMRCGAWWAVEEPSSHRCH